MADANTQKAAKIRMVVERSILGFKVKVCGTEKGRTACLAVLAIWRRRCCTHLCVFLRARGRARGRALVGTGALP